jgi:hypothetical protein
MPWVKRKENQMSAIQCQSRITIAFVAIVLSLAVLTSGCQVKQDLIIQGKENQEIQLVTDSTAVRLMISNEEAVERAVLDSWQKNSRPENTEQQMKDVEEHPERYTPGRNNFLALMEQQPRVIVHGRAHLDIVKTSGAPCTLIPLASPDFADVRVREGPDRGKEGWLCSDQIDVNDERNVVVGPSTAPPIKTTLCELLADPDKYVGRVVEIRAAVEEGFEVSLLVDDTCSARIWFDQITANLDREHYRRIEAYLRSNNQVATVVGRFDHVGWFSWRFNWLYGYGNGFGHLGQWQSQLVMQSFKRR